ncbi:MAG: hypothetical protein M3345_04565 [Actinomycetota bacterium]|nr:hypothetical protein [Actinomycetota bacterium]
MAHNFSNEIGRMRIEEMVARGERYRLAQKKTVREEPVATSQKVARFSYRKALAAVALSLVALVLMGATAFASPAGVGTSGAVGTKAGSTEPTVTAVEAASNGSWIVLAVVLAGLALSLTFAHRHNRSSATS